MKQSKNTKEGMILDRDKTRKGVGGWNRDGTEDWRKHNWFYKYIPQYINGEPMYVVHKRNYDRKYNSKMNCVQYITLNKKTDWDCIEVIDHHIPNLTNFVKFCLRSYADYYQLFDDEANDTEIE